MKQKIKINESQLKQIVSECVKTLLNEIDVTPPKRSKEFFDMMDWYRQEYPENWTDTIDSDVPEDWLSDSNYRRAHLGGKIKLEKPKYDRHGFDQETGLHKDTGTNRDSEGYNAMGLDKQGFNRKGRGLAGYDREGYDKRGMNKDGIYRSGRHNWTKILSDIINNFYEQNIYHPKDNNDHTFYILLDRCWKRNIISKYNFKGQSRERMWRKFCRMFYKKYGLTYPF